MTVRNSLDDALTRARREGRSALIPYVTGGFPDQDTFVDLVVTILDAGADALEIGIPFSDPLLDGPSIQRSQQRALDQGVTPVDCLRFAAEVRARSDKPLLFMGAYNPVLAYGLDRFCQDAAASGITGLIVPDLPYEEQRDLRRVSGDRDLHLIQLVAPTSTPDRVERVCALSSGFVYCVSVAGVTGARASVVDTARPLVERVKLCTDVPIAVGFGIAGPEQARAVAAFADAVIVGAAVIDTIADAPAGHEAAAVGRFVADLRESLDASAVRA